MVSQSQLTLAQAEILLLRRVFRAEQRGLKWTAVLETAEVALNEDPRESNMTLLEEDTVPVLGTVLQTMPSMRWWNCGDHTPAWRGPSCNQLFPPTVTVSETYPPFSR